MSLPSEMHDLLMEVHPIAKGLFDYFAVNPNYIDMNSERLLPQTRFKKSPLLIKFEYGPVNKMHIQVYDRDTCDTYLSYLFNGQAIESLNYQMPLDSSELQVINGQLP